jgi:hypothetical protein
MIVAEVCPSDGDPAETFYSLLHLGSVILMGCKKLGLLVFCVAELGMTMGPLLDLLFNLSKRIGPLYTS